MASGLLITAHTPHTPLRLAGQDSTSKKLGWRPGTAFWGPYVAEQMPYDMTGTTPSSEMEPEKRLKEAKKHWKVRIDLSEAGREDLEYKLDPKGAAKRNKITGLGVHPPTWCPEIQAPDFVCMLALCVAHVAHTATLRCRSTLSSA